MEKSDSKSSGLDSTTSTKSFESQIMNKPNENLIMMDQITQKPKSSGDSMVITILGSGDFGRALALRMVQSGYTVCIGSRNPERNRYISSINFTKKKYTEILIRFHKFFSELWWKKLVPN